MGLGKGKIAYMSTSGKLTPEILVPRIGDYLVEKGLLKPEDLVHALKVQKEIRASGKHILLGQVLLDMKVIDRSSLDQVITEQILQLRAALQESNQQLERRVQERTSELQAALKRLSELNQLKSNIIANVSHEFRTPLTHIKGYLELLTSKSLGTLSAEQTDALATMKKSSERLEELINGLLQFSTASTGELSLNLSHVKTMGFLQDMYEQTRAKAQEHHITFSLDTPSFLPEINIDKEKITWAISQLLDNAIKFSTENGHVTLKAVQEGNFVNFTVVDDGIGVPPEKIPELFTPFHQLDGSSTRHYGGTGLGLAVVKQIIDAHGSVIRVYSRVGQGTRIEFILPVVNAK
jgi:two-component system sensor histidine kinase BarA